MPPVLPYIIENNGDITVTAFNRHEPLRLAHFNDVSASLVVHQDDQQQAPPAVTDIVTVPNNLQQSYGLVKHQQLRDHRAKTPDPLYRIPLSTGLRTVLSLLLQLAVDWETECQDGLPRPRFLVDSRQCEKIQMLLCLTRPCDAREKLDMNAVQYLLYLLAMQAK